MTVTPRAVAFVLQVYDRVIFHAEFSTLQGLVIGTLVVIGFDFALLNDSPILVTHSPPMVHACQNVVIIEPAPRHTLRA